MKFNRLKSTTPNEDGGPICYNQMVKKKIILILSVGVILVFAFALLAHASFSDVIGNKYQAAIDFIQSRNVVSGYPDGTYRPDTQINRAELLTIIVGQQYQNLQSKNCFTDVSNSEWYAKFVCKGQELGFTSGYPDGSFRPADNVNFVEALIMLQRAHNIAVDTSTSPWYKNSVDSASTMNIIPLDVNEFNEKITRGQMAEMITRILKQQENTMDDYLGSKKYFSVTYDDIKDNLLVENNWQNCISGNSIFCPPVYVNPPEPTPPPSPNPEPEPPSPSSSCSDSSYDAPNLNPSYVDILNYPSLLNIKSYLQNEAAYLDDNQTTTGYQVVLSFLNDGYDGLQNKDIQQQFIGNEFAKYSFHYRAEKNFIVHVVHSIWVEKNRLVPWSLKGYSQAEISQLFWIDSLQQNIKSQTSLSTGLYENENPDITLEEQAPYKLFAIAHQLQKSGDCSTVKSILQWQKKNFFHAYYDYGWDRYQDGRPDSEKLVLGDGSSIFSPISLERLFDERITGCHENALLLTEFLRSINIPAVSINRLGHGVTYLPTIDKYVHGDHIADFHTVPVNDYLLSAQDVTNISGDSSNYDAVFKELYPFPRIYFTNIELHRDESNLFLETNSVCTAIPPADMEKMRSEVPEFNLKYDQSKCMITSDRVPLKSLADLSQHL